MHRRIRHALKIRNLHRGPLRGGFRNRLLAEADPLLVELGDQLLAHAVRGPQMKLLGRRVQHIDRAGFGIGKLHRFGNDRRKHRLQLQGGVDGLRHLTERAQLFHRLTELVGPRAQLVQQPYILDRDHGLAGEVPHQVNLLVGKRPDLLAIDSHGADQFILLEHRHDQDRPSAPDIDERCNVRMAVAVGLCRL